MSRAGHSEWQAISSSRSVRDSGCAEGAWVDALVWYLIILVLGLAVDIKIDLALGVSLNFFCQ